MFGSESCVGQLMILGRGSEIYVRMKSIQVFQPNAATELQRAGGFEQARAIPCPIRMRKHKLRRPG